MCCHNWAVIGQRSLHACSQRIWFFKPQDYLKGRHQYAGFSHTISVLYNELPHTPQSHTEHGLSILNTDFNTIFSHIVQLHIKSKIIHLFTNKPHIHHNLNPMFLIHVILKWMLPIHVTIKQVLNTHPYVQILWAIRCAIKHMEPVVKVVISGKRLNGTSRTINRLIFQNNIQGV